jgi:hypothetical protein
MFWKLMKNLMTVKQFGAWHDDNVLAVWPVPNCLQRSLETLSADEHSIRYLLSKMVGQTVINVYL